MLVKSLKIKNIVNIESLDLDIDSLGEGIIAIVGENGAGKTHVMESLLPVPLFREWVSTPRSATAKKGEGFLKHCTGNESSVELCLRFGENDFKLLLLGQGSSQEGYCYVNDKLLNPSGKVSEYDDCIKTYFPSRDIIFSGPFAMQTGDGAFYSLSKDARRELFTKLLGLDKIDFIIERIVNALSEATEHVEEHFGTAAKLSELKQKLSEFRVDFSLLQKHRDELNSVIDGISCLLLELRCAIDRDKEKFNRKIFLENQLIEIQAAYNVPVGDVLNYGLYSDIVEDLKADRDVLVKKIAKLKNEMRFLDESNTHFLSNLNKNISTFVDSASHLSLVDIHHPMCRRCKLTSSAMDASIKMELYRESLSLGEMSYAGERTWMMSIIESLEMALCNYDDGIMENLAKIPSVHPLCNSGLNLLEQRDSIQGELSEIGNLEEYIEASYNIGPLYEELQGAEVEKASVDGSLSMIAKEIDKLEKSTIEHEEKSKLSAPHRAKANDLDIIKEILLNLRMELIQDSCPSVQEAANIILEEFIGGRFRVRLDTQVIGSRGLPKNDFVCSIIDTLTGREGTSASPGEMSVLSEALRLSLSVYNTNKIDGVRFETLFRDETTASLSNKNAMAYIPMLRKTMELGGFKKIFLISHHENVYRQADTKIYMDNGRIVDIK